MVNRKQEPRKEPGTVLGRRTFLKATGSAFALPYLVPDTVLGQGGRAAPSDRIVMGGIGIGNMGRGDQGAFLKRDDVQYVAACDVQQRSRDQSKQKIDSQYKNSDCKTYNDFREMLARPDIDAVHCATPDHWHALIVIEACRNGKDVYCQKPETKTLREGRLMIEAARRYKRVVSGGSQRVLGDYRKVVNPCWAGEKGKIKSINVNVGPLAMECNKKGEPIPEGFDWDMWLGPAPWAPFHPHRCSGSFKINGTCWRSFVDYSGGGMTDWGAHHFGGATFAIDVRELEPEEVILHDEGGKRYATCRYPNGQMIHHNHPGKKNMEVEGSDEKKEPKPVPGYAGTGGIYGDFIDCVKTRKQPFRDIEIAVHTVMVCHLFIACYQLGRSLKWDTVKQQFVDDTEANRLLDVPRREPWVL